MTFSRCCSQWWVTLPPATERSKYSLKLQLKRQTMKMKKDAQGRLRCGQWHYSLCSGSNCSTLEEGLGCKLALASGLDGHLWPPVAETGVLINPEPGSWEHTGTNWRAEMRLGTLVLTPEGLSWKAKSLCCCLRQEGRKKHLVDLRTWEEISLVLLGCIKIWAL